MHLLTITSDETFFELGGVRFGNAFPCEFDISSHGDITEIRIGSDSDSVTTMLTCRPRGGVDAVLFQMLMPALKRDFAHVIRERVTEHYYEMRERPEAA